MRLREISTDARFFWDFLQNFVSGRCNTRVTQTAFTTGAQGFHRELLFPIPAVDHAFNPIAEMQDVKVDEQTHRNSTQTHVRQKLSFVDRMDCFDGLYFNDDFSIDDQVDSISDFELLTFIYDRQRN